MNPTRICSIEGCTGRHEARGWCGKHYQQWKKYGDPLATEKKRAMVSTEKSCTTCGETKPLDEFHRDPRLTDGRRAVCKICRTADSAKYRAENPEVRDAYNARNSERIRKQAADNYANNVEYYRAYRAEYYASNRNVYWETTYRTRARKFGFNPVVKSFTLADLIEKYGNNCHHCSGPFEELDHYPKPVGLGGDHSLDNCVPSCVPCNRNNAWAIRLERTKMSRL